MTIVTTSVHHARVFRNVISLIRFDDRQGIHIKAQQDRRTRLVTFEQPDDSGLADSGSHLKPQPIQFLRHNAAGANLLKAEFGMFMKITAAGDHFLFEFFCLL